MVELRRCDVGGDATVVSGGYMSLGERVGLGGWVMIGGKDSRNMKNLKMIITQQICFQINKIKFIYFYC